MVKFIAVGVFPPPYTGQSVAFQKFYNEFLSSNACFYDVSGISVLPYKLAKLFKYLYLFPMMIFHRREKLYYTLNSGSGLYLDLFFLLYCKMLGVDVILHHHSYGYINKHSQIVQRISEALSKDVMIFLSPKMRDDFNRVYGFQGASFTLNNIFQYDMSEYGVDEKYSDTTSLKIGFISNLAIEKGLDIVCRLVEELSSKNLNVKVVLAGPFADAEAKNRFEMIPEGAQGYVDYIGPVYGDDKSAFFENLDLFVFPTLYENEAQPMVLVEALQYGVPAISTDRGAISDLLGPDFPTVEADGFIGVVLDSVDSMLASDVHRTALTKKAYSRFRELKEISSNEVDAIKRLLK